MNLDFIKRLSQEIKIHTKWFRTYSSNGVKILGDGRTLLILEKENNKYFLSIEPLNTTPLSWALYWDSLSLDEKFKIPITDNDTRNELLATAIAYFHNNKYLVSDIDSLEGL